MDAAGIAQSWPKQKFSFIGTLMNKEGGWSVGTVAVTIVVVCVMLYTVFEMIENRKRRKFNENLRRYIQEHKGDWSDADKNLH